jgi:hypothetical protein
VPASGARDFTQVSDGLDPCVRLAGPARGDIRIGGGAFSVEVSAAQLLGGEERAQGLEGVAPGAVAGGAVVPADGLQGVELGQLGQRLGAGQGQGVVARAEQAAHLPRGGAAREAEPLEGAPLGQGGELPLTATKEVTEPAAALGITAGMTGREALEKLA